MAASLPTITNFTHKTGKFPLFFAQVLLVAVSPYLGKPGLAVSVFRPDSQFTLPTLITTILFLAYTLVTLLRAVLRAETVTLDTTNGALNVYLLVAFGWGAAYVLLEKLHAG